MLDLSGAGLTGAGVGALLAAFEDPAHPLKVLTLGGNTLGPNGRAGIEAFEARHGKR